MNDSWGGIMADELREAWGGHLRPIPEGLIAAVVSPDTRRLLTEVGLPTAEVLGIDFVFDDRLSSVALRGGREHLVVTGARSFLSFAVDPETDQVFEFDRRDPGDTSFVNSDLATLILFLGQVWRAMSLNEVPAVEAALAEIRASLSMLDPAAVEERAPWWYLLDELESSVE